MTDVLLLSSGGLDSTTLAYWLCNRKVSATPIFFDYGQHCVEKEWSTLQDVLPADMLERLQRVDISEIFRGSTSRLISEANLWSEDIDPAELYIPYRTLLFFTAAAAIAQTHGLTDVYSGFINSNHAKELDCSASFLNNLDKFSENVGPVRFRLPFRDMSKREVAALARSLSVPIGRTFSCQVFSDVPCGACPNCVDRIDALTELAVGR
jgi:7-cyano-7-deazaguanine synthase